MSETADGTQKRQLPAEVTYRNQVMNFAKSFVIQQVGEEQAEVLVSQFGLAFREAAFKNPDLYGVDPRQVAWAVARSAMTNLMPGGPLPHVDLIVRKGKLNWQVSSRGWQKLAEDAGWLLETVPVFADDHFVYRRVGTDTLIEHTPDPWAAPDYKQLKGFLIFAHDIHNRGIKSRHRLVPKAKIEQLRSHADTQRVWNLHPMEMAEKAAKAYVIRRGLVTMTRGSRQALAFDEQHEAPPLEHAAVLLPEAPQVEARGVAGVLAAVAEPDAPTNGEGHAPETQAKSDRDASIREGIAGEIGSLADQLGGEAFDKVRAGRTLSSLTNPELDKFRMELRAALKLQREALPEEPEEPEDNGPDPLDEVRRLMTMVPMSVVQRLKKEAGGGTPIRLRAYNDKVQKFEELLRAHLATPPEAGDPVSNAESTEPWDPEEVEAGIKALDIADRKKCCAKANVGCSSMGVPHWDDLSPADINRLGDIVDATLAEREG